MLLPRRIILATFVLGMLPIYDWCLSLVCHRLLFIDRSKERINVQRLSAVCTALKYHFEDDDSTTNPMDFDGGDSDHEYSDSPFWQLFSAVKKYVTPDGDDISQPFCKLPSKK